MKTSYKMAGIINYCKMVLFVLVVLIPLFIGLNKGYTQPITLTYSTYLPKDNTLAQIDKAWMDEVSRRYAGKLKFKTFYGGTLLKAPDAYRGIGRGMADLGFHATMSYTPDATPLTTVAALVFMEEKLDVYAKAYNELMWTHPALIKEDQKNNVKFLYAPGVAQSVLGTTVPIKQVEDMKGIKIRIHPGPAPAFEAVGSVPVSLPFGELYDALQKDVVQAYAAVPFEFAITYGLHEVGKYITDAGVGVYGTSAMHINLKTWKNLPDDLKKIMKEEAIKVPEKYWPMVMEANNRLLPKALKDDVKIHIMSNEEKSKWQTIAEKYHNNWIENRNNEGLPGQEVYDTYNKLLEKYRPGKYKTVFQIWEEKYKRKK